MTEYLWPYLTFMQKKDSQLGPQEVNYKANEINNESGFHLFAFHLPIQMSAGTWFFIFVIIATIVWLYLRYRLRRDDKRSTRRRGRKDHDKDQDDQDDYQDFLDWKKGRYSQDNDFQAPRPSPDDQRALPSPQPAPAPAPASEMSIMMPLLTALIAQNNASPNAAANAATAACSASPYAMPPRPTYAAPYSPYATQSVYPDLRKAQTAAPTDSAPPVVPNNADPVARRTHWEDI